MILPLITFMVGWKHVSSENGDSIFPWNTDIYLSVHIASQPKTDIFIAVRASNLTMNFKVLNAT
jgi:hypothetical protein